MNRLVKKKVFSKEEQCRALVKKHCRVYKHRLGQFRYTVVFPHAQSIGRYKQGLFLSDNEVNGVPDGLFNKVLESDIKGTLMDVQDIPMNILNLLAMEIKQNGNKNQNY